MGDLITYSVPESVEASTADTQLHYFDKAAFDTVVDASIGAHDKAALFAQMARFNTLYMIARAGSGHIGSSFSSMDIVSWLYLNVLQPGDRYFSSKGHDAPGLYSVQAALGILPFEKIHALRRLGGLPGHPDVGTPGAFTNTGSLGMGVSKAKGFLVADDLASRPARRIFVLTGDGELQEGQLWESLIGAANRRADRLTLIVDHNKLQSDTLVSRVSDLGDLEAKFAAFGWDVQRCSGHDFGALERLLGGTRNGLPRVIIADTIKGRGAPAMEHTAMKPGQVYYAYHSGAPNRADYLAARDALVEDIEARARRHGVTLPLAIGVHFEPLLPPRNAERMIPAYTDAILAEARQNPMLVALDADLVLDTGLIPFKDEFPRRFIECGIAEQDMVSQAGTMALGGLLPVVHSFSCFLTSRASEQIYNNCTQGGRVIYVGSLAGLLPGGPGHSHQAVRDIAAMSAMPGMALIEPIDASQVGQSLHWAVNTHTGSTYLRLTSIPYERRSELNGMTAMIDGRGHLLRPGQAGTIVAAGPVMTQIALDIAERIAAEGHSIAVIAMPWLNRFDAVWFRETLRNRERHVFVLENHYGDLGFGSWFVDQLAVHGVAREAAIQRFGLREVPASGRNDEVLRHHGLDAESLATAISGAIGGR